MKKFLVVLLGAIMVFALSGCGSQASTSSASSSSSAAVEETETVELEDTLIVYSTHPEAQLEAIADEFTAQTGVNVEFINLKGELADRVQSEIGNPQADVMFGGDTSVYMQLDEAGAFESTKPDWASELPADYKAANGDWYATITTPVMMFYNTDKIDESEAPKDWSDLTDSKYAGQIVARDYVSSSMRSAICNLIYYFEQDGGEAAAEEFLSGLDANVKNYYNSGSMMFQSIGAGDASVGISTLNDITDNINKNGMPLQVINATSGNVIISDCVAALKDCAHPNAAAAFVEFVGSKDVELMLANDFNRIPALPEAREDAPEWMQGDLTALPADWSVIAENQAAWLEMWQNNIYNDSKTVASS